MHNKFLIFSKVEESTEDHGIETVTPYAVWTGSFNLTKNATMSLENALFITDKKIVNAYFEEYGQIAAMSEELNWSSEWTAPEWRIGT
jgi:phosphatidylserine/phosphatidylglycerophosphate/cardiolipin synthase-like enzyme